MNTYIFNLQRNSIKKESIIRAEDLADAMKQIEDEQEQEWHVTALSQNGTPLPEDQWKKE